MLKLQRKQVKIFCVLLALVFVGSVVALALSQSGSNIVSAASSSNVGVVDMRALLTSHPDFAKVNEQLNQASQEAKMRFDADTANKSDAEKAQAYQKAMQELQTKQEQLVGDLEKKVNAAVKQVADAKGLTVVVDKSAVVYGGQDITQDVQKKFQ